jgi:lipid II isoglutaminyl synthase (glutamine-hydrolysing)
VESDRTVLRITTLYPELLGTYGDGGNALVLAQRARGRGIDVERRDVAIGEDVPESDIFLLGGGEDGPQTLAADLLRSSSLERQVADGATVFAVCAGLQILGESFATATESRYPGLGLVDVCSVRGSKRAVGDVLTDVDGFALVGFENHAGVTELGPSVAPFGRVVVGRGNDGVYDGFSVGRIKATYAHGPVLAQNPWLADLLLGEALDQTLEPLLSVADLLHDERVRRVRH